MAATSSRHQHDPAARAEAVRRIRAGDVPTDVARDLGLPARTVRRWAADDPGPRPPAATPPPPAIVDAPAAEEAPRPRLVIAGREASGDEEVEDLVEALVLSGRWRRREVRKLSRMVGRSIEDLTAERGKLLDEAEADLDAPESRRRADLVLQTRDLVALAKAAKDISGTTRALSLLARLQGLERINMEHSGSVDVQRAASPDELQERRAAIKRRLLESPQ